MTEHERSCWGVLRRTHGDAAFPEVIPLCAARVVIGRRPEHYTAPDTVFRTASAHDDALPDVPSTAIDRVALASSKRISKVHCVFQRTDAAVVEVHTNNGFAVNQAPVGKGTRAVLKDGDAVQLLGAGPGQPGVFYALALRGAPTWPSGTVFYDEAVVDALRARGATQRAALKALREIATRLEAAVGTVERSAGATLRLTIKRRGREDRRGLLDETATSLAAAADAFEGSQAALAAGRAALAAIVARPPGAAVDAGAHATPEGAGADDGGAYSSQSVFQYDVSQTQDSLSPLTSPSAISPLTSPSVGSARRASHARRRADATAEAAADEAEARRSHAAAAEAEARRLSHARRVEAVAVAAQSDAAAAARRASQERHDHALALSFAPPSDDSDAARRASQERHDHALALSLQDRAPTPRARSPPRGDLAFAAALEGGGRKRRRHFDDHVEPDDDASDDDVVVGPPSAAEHFYDLARGDGDASALLRRGLAAQGNRPAATRARRALLAVAEEDFHWWREGSDVLS